MSASSERSRIRLPTNHQWFSSIASVIHYVWGDSGTLDMCAEWTVLHDDWKNTITVRRPLHLTAHPLPTVA